jgi:hypothetical protein
MSPEAAEGELLERPGLSSVYQFRQMPEILARVLRTSAALCDHEYLSGTEMDRLGLNPEGQREPMMHRLARKCNNSLDTGASAIVFRARNSGLD